MSVIPSSNDILEGSLPHLHASTKSLAASMSAVCLPSASCAASPTDRSSAGSGPSRGGPRRALRVERGDCLPLRCTQLTTSKISVGWVRPLTWTTSRRRERKPSDGSSAPCVAPEQMTLTPYALHRPSRRAARLIVSPMQPNFILENVPMLPVSTCPEWMPMRIFSVGSCNFSKSKFRSFRAICCATAALQALAWCLAHMDGVFQNDNMPSPKISPTSPA
mmetsp:Transcript_28240/g.85092  ORF Transcript_28240/g.85092 Transcript_28240/m.85092 type:complete len:220 (-) Transcript_28240:213-872(-)